MSTALLVSCIRSFRGFTTNSHIPTSEIAYPNRAAKTIDNKNDHLITGSCGHDLTLDLRLVQ